MGNRSVVIDSYHMGNYECVQSVAVVKFSIHGAPYYVVGTAFTVPVEHEPKKGRLLVFQLSPSKHLKLVTSSNVKGAVYDLCEYEGMLLCGINSIVRSRGCTSLSHTHPHTHTPTRTYFVGYSVSTHRKRRDGIRIEPLRHTPWTHSSVEGGRSWPFHLGWRFDEVHVATCLESSNASFGGVGS